VLAKLKPPLAGFQPVLPSEEKSQFETLGELAHDGKQVGAVVFSGDGKRLVTATDDGTVTVWNVAEQRQEKRFSAANEPIAALAVSFDGKRALGAVGNRGVIWNLETGEQVCELVGHKTKIVGVALSGDSRLACTQAAEEDDGLRPWDAQAGAELQHQTAKHYGRGTALMLSPDGRSILMDGLEFQVALYDVASLRSEFEARRREHFTLQDA
jgi:WD40 repeat protein